MAGFFAAAAKVPISTLVMVAELTGSYRLVVPALWVSALAFLLGRRFQLYESQVPTRLQSGAHRHELHVDVLRGVRVAEVLATTSPEPIVTVRDTLPLARIVRVFARTTQHYFPVVDADGTMVGILSANDVRQMLDEHGASEIVIASDLATTDVVTVSPTHDLESALQKFVALDVEALPVVDPSAPGRVAAMLSRREVIHAYDRARHAWLRGSHDGGLD